MISLEERAHDVADMVSNWELDHISKRAQEEQKNVNINVYSLYKKYYGQLLNIFSQDPVFNADLSNSNEE